MVTRRNVGFMGIPNPDRQEELFEVINQYKDPSTNVLDATNPDYLAAIDAVNQKYADNMFMTPQELEDSGFTGSTFNLSATGDPTTTTTSDPLSMGSNQGALSNITDGTDSNVMQGSSNVSTVTGENEFGVPLDQFGVPLYGPGSAFIPSGVTKDDSDEYVVDSDQYGMPGLLPITGGKDTKALTEYDQYVEDQDIPIVDGFAVFDKNQHTMGGFDIGAGESRNSTPVYVDDDGVVRYSSGQALNLPSSVLEEIKNAAPIPPMQVFETVGNQFGQADQYIDTTSAMKDIGYTDYSQIEFLYYHDKDTGKTYVYDNNEKEFRGTGPSNNAELVGGVYKVKGHDDKKAFSITEEDKKKYDFSGILGTDPETAAEYARLKENDDKSDNDIYYEYEGRRYVDVTGTGQGIPVGATNIVQGNLGLSQLGAPDVNEEGIITGYSNQTDQGFFTSPVLAKTYEGYVSSPTSGGQYISEFTEDSEGKTVENEQYNFDDLTPTAGTSFTDSFLTLGEDAKPFDVGQLFGFESGKIVMSNPASNRMNLESFFNNVNSQTFSNYLRGQQDKIDLINRYSLGALLSGFYGGTVLDENGNPINLLSEDGKRYMNLDGAFDYTYDEETGKIESMRLGDNFENVFNEFLSGEDDPQTLANFGDATTGQFAKETGKDDFTKYTDNNGGKNNDGKNGDGKNGNGNGKNGNGNGKNGNGNGKNGDGKNGDNKTPDETEPFVVRAYKGGGVGPFARNYIFQRFGYTPTETIDMLLRYDPVQELYFFEDGSPVDPEFLQNMQLTKLDDKGQVVRDEDGNAVRMPKVVINNEEEE
jgi:hypothetical protein